jgi:hypothetical protein
MSAQEPDGRFDMRSNLNGILATESEFEADISRDLRNLYGTHEILKGKPILDYHLLDHIFEDTQFPAEWMYYIPVVRHRQT